MTRRPRAPTRQRAPMAPRTPMNVILPSFEEAEEREILAVMRPWPPRLPASHGPQERRRAHWLRLIGHGGGGWRADLKLRGMQKSRYKKLRCRTNQIWTSDSCGSSVSAASLWKGELKRLRRSNVGAFFLKRFASVAASAITRQFNQGGIVSRPLDSTYVQLAEAH
jgi:hypothetical protein